MKIARAALCLLLVLPLPSCRTTKQEQTGFMDRSLTIGDATYAYVVYLPRNYERWRPWPVIVSLHGIGERGSDGHRATQIGLARTIRSGPERVPAIAIFPQAPLGTTWLGQTADAAMLALDRSMIEFNGDPDRVYLTGLSMGGYGVWHLALAHPDRFAALVPVCGGILPQAPVPEVLQSPLSRQGADPHAFVAHALRHLPVWIFHGAADTTISVSESRRMADELRREGAMVRYTEYPGVGHNAWDPAYAEPELWQWLFAQRRKGTPARQE